MSSVLTVAPVADHDALVSMVSAARAASLLGVSARSIRQYVRRGVLHGGRGQVRPGDVLVLERERKDRYRHRIDRRTFDLALARVDILRGQIGELAQIWDLAAGELTRDELVSMYNAAQVFLEHAPPADSAATWAVIFSRLRMNSLAILKRATQDAQPWRCFFGLYVVLSAEMRRTCGVPVTTAIGARLTRLARSWLEQTVGPRALHAAIRAAGAAPDRLLAREIRSRHRRAA